MKSKEESNQEKINIILIVIFAIISIIYSGFTLPSVIIFAFLAIFVMVLIFILCRLFI